MKINEIYYPELKNIFYNILKFDFNSRITVLDAQRIVFDNKIILEMKIEMEIKQIKAVEQ